MLENEFHNSRLIAGHLQGTLSPSEAAELSIWLAADPANLAFFESFSELEHLTEELSYYLNAEREEVWNKVQSQLKGDKISVRPLKAKLWPRIAVAAAVATMIFGAAALFYFSSRSVKSKQNSAYANDVAPGRQGATLTLASGKKIRLTDAVNGVLASEAGVSISKSAKGNLVYTFTNVSGEDKINTLATANGETYELHLPDGSFVWLNSASSLTYSAALTRQGKRLVSLRGEAYFQVAKDKAHPFLVTTENQQVEVLGTHFNINSYSDEQAVVTTLLEGSVRISSLRSMKHPAKTILKPGFQAINDGKEVKVSQADLESITDWKEGEFYMNHVGFKAAMRKLARWYDVEVIYATPVPDDLKFGGWVSRSEKLSTVLHSIESAGLVHFRVEGRKIYVEK